MIFHFRNGSIIVEDKYNTDIAGIVFFHEERYRRINTLAQHGEYVSFVQKLCFSFINCLL